MAVVRGLGPVARNDLLEPPHVLRQLLGGDGRVLDVGQRLRVALDGHGEAEARLPQRVPLPLLRGVVRHHRGVAEPAPLHVGLERGQLRPHLRFGVAVELDEQQLAGVAHEVVQQVPVAGVPAAVVDDHVSDELDGRGAVLKDRHSRLHAFDEVGEVQNAQALVRRQRHEVHLGFGDHGEGALGADQRAREVHGAVAHEIVQVVAHHATQQLGKTAPDLVGVVVREPAHLAVHRALEAASRHPLLQRPPGDGREVRPRTVRQDGVNLEHVVERLAVDHRVRPAGVVADTPAYGRPLTRDRVRAVHEAMLAHGGAEMVVDDARLHPRPPLLGRDLQDAAHVLREVDDNGVIARLTGQRRAAAPRKHRDAVLARHEQRRQRIVGAARDDDADRHHLIHRRVGRVHQAAVAVHADIARNLLAQLLGNLSNLALRELRGLTRVS